MILHQNLLSVVLAVMEAEETVSVQTVCAAHNGDIAERHQTIVLVLAVMDTEETESVQTVCAALNLDGAELHQRIVNQMFKRQGLYQNLRLNRQQCPATEQLLNRHSSQRLILLLSQLLSPPRAQVLE